MKKSFLTWCILIASTATLQAAPVTLDPIVVTATRTATALSQIGSSVTVVTAEEIEEKQQTSVVDVLRSVPGVNLAQTGPTGGAVSVYLRGTDTKHTLVLIDGMEFRDPSGFGGADLSNLTTDNIDRIEIARGSQSVLYGSDAIGGVINIITKKGSKTPQANLTVEGGSYNTFKESAGFSFGGDNVQTSFSVSRTDSDGYSALNEDDGLSEDDGYKNTTVMLNVGAQLTEKFEFKLNLRSTEAKYEYDGSVFDMSTFTFVPKDLDNVQETSERMARLEGTFHLFDDAWTMTLGTSASTYNRLYQTELYGRSEYDGQLTKFDIQNTIAIGDNQTVVIGAETEKAEYDNGKNRNTSIYIQDQISLGNFSTAVGLRLDDHEEFGQETTWRIAPTYKFEKTNTRLKASVGKGIKAPTLYQLYSPYGNEDLDAETSFSWDLGIEQALFDKSLIINLTYFFNDIDDYIDFYDNGTPSNYDDDHYSNIKTLETKGVESTIDWYASEYFTINLGYTYTDSKDASNERKARIPLHKGSMGISVYPVDNLTFNTNVIYTSQRDDTAETLGEYTLVNVATSYQINDRFEIFGRVNNLFDEDYEEIAGYGTAGVSVYAGVKLTF